MERDPLVRACLLLLATIGLLWLGGWAWQVVSRFADVLLLFFLAWLLAFVLTPVSRWLQGLGLSALLSVGAVYLLLGVVLVTIGLVVVPIAVAQLVQLGSSLPVLATELQARADQLHLELVRRGLPEAQLSDLYRTAIARAESAGTLLLTNTLTIATSLVGGMLRGMLILIISFYLMLDGDKIATLFVQSLPARYRDSAAGGLEQIDRTFGGFVRGQLIQTAVYGLGTALVMQAAQLPYAVVLSIFAGVMMLIPIIGPVLAIVPPLILALILSPGKLWWIFVLLQVLQFVVVNVMAPRIMGRSVGIHPLLVFAAVLIGAQVAQGWGAIFSVPVAAMLMLLLRAFYQRVVLHMPLYRQGVRLSPEALVPANIAAPAAESTSSGPATASDATPASMPASPSTGSAAAVTGSTGSTGSMGPTTSAPPVTSGAPAAHPPSAGAAAPAAPTGPAAPVTVPAAAQRPPGVRRAHPPRP